MHPCGDPGSHRVTADALPHAPSTELLYTLAFFFASFSHASLDFLFTYKSKQLIHKSLL